MKRFLMLPLFAPLFWVALAGAQPPPSDADEPGVVRHLHRNRHLIRALVQGGLSLAREQDALRRADYCNGLARSVVGEIRQAADVQDNGRAIELGDHLQALLKLGVAGNLTSVRLVTPPGSTREIEMRRVSHQMNELTEPLQGLLEKLAPPDEEDLGRILTGLREARVEVEAVLKSRPEPEPNDK